MDSALTQTILRCCFETINVLGSGFLECVYRNALMISLADAGLKVAAEQSYDVLFRDQRVGRFVPDIIVENAVVLELKCCSALLPEHQAQLINYLKVTGIPTGLLINFGSKRLEYKRAYLDHVLNL